MIGRCGFNRWEESMLGKFIKTRHKEFGTNEEGVSAIEFAFVGPPFLLLIGMILETGLMLFTEYALQAGVQEAARTRGVVITDAQVECVTAQLAAVVSYDDLLAGPASDGSGGIPESVASLAVRMCVPAETLTQLLDPSTYLGEVGRQRVVRRLQIEIG